jgi:Na+-driven multidrug efflux pump
MIAMLLGAVLNIILDPIFIFVFRWGVEGVAWATVICQAVSSFWILRFIMGEKAIIRLSLSRPSIAIIKQIIAFGSAQSLLQFLMASVLVLYNKSMGWYAVIALGVENGGDIGLTGINIVFTISTLILMPVFGINQGAQPILGYNYGARQFDRVLQAYLKAITAATVICFAGFAAVALFPVQIVRVFAPGGSAELMDFAPRAMRTMLLLLPLAGFKIISTNLFVVTGRPKISIFLSLLRQCLILIPGVLVFGWAWGLWGVIAAAPVSDTFAFFITGVMIFFELQKLRGTKAGTS